MPPLLRSPFMITKYVIGTSSIGLSSHPKRAA